MKRLKAAVAVLFVAGFVVVLADRAGAYPPFVAKAKKFGAKDCKFCHVDPEGGPGWNERGKWLIAEKERRKADAVDVEWLADFKPGVAIKKDDKTPKVEPMAASADAVEQELLGLLNQLIEAAKKRDTSVFDRVLADEFSEINAQGLVFTKAQVLAAIAEYNLESYTVSETATRVFGDAAVLTFREAVQGSFRGQNVGGDFRETLVWVKRSGQWQLVSAHISRVAGKTSGAVERELLKIGLE